jgi:Prokaryotic membrane lipoprotein lipid attachment site
MKRAIITAGLLLAVAGCSNGQSSGHTSGTGHMSGPITGSPAVSGSPGLTSVGHGTCTHPYPGNPHITACVYPSGLYSISYRLENQYYWHPAPGYFAVAETYYKPNAPGRAAGAWTGRAISVGDSCLVDDEWIPNLKTPPGNCLDARDGEYRSATSEEQRSVLAFWRVMTAYIPGNQR